MFISFGPNTFTGKEWGDGKEDPKVFNPTQLDARQWARTAKEAGMKAIIFVAKHHDGFCLFPSKYSTHTVRESAWKDGKGDVLREISDACKEYDLKFGVYLSPWDRNHPDYGTPYYNQVFANMLNEVYSGYGPVFEQWFDGANGEDENGKKQEYDWDFFNQTVYHNQQSTVIFSDIGPGCRWVGNEKGVAGTTNWSTLNTKGFEPGAKAPATTTLNAGEEDGAAWIPAESDVSIRPGWFYSPATDDSVKSADKLMEIYYSSVGRNSNLLLNVPPDRRGLIPAKDSLRLMEFRRLRELTFKNNLALNAKVTASSSRNNVKPDNLVDGDASTYWASPDTALTPVINLNFKKAVTFNRLLLQEYIALGQRVKRFKVEVLDHGQYKEIANETTIGHKRILLLPDTKTKAVRITITGAKACPVLSEVQLFDAPKG
jgi:alpha-L-fucosidase